MTLENKNAVVTGSNRGIGRSIVETFAKNGCETIWACARKQNDDFEAEMSGISQKYGTEIIPVYFELTDTSEITEAVKNNIHGKKVDILVNTAGVTHNDAFGTTSMDTFRSVFEINFFAPVYLIKLISRTMIRQKQGSIINITSIAGLDTHPTNCTYGTSKAALNFFTKILASELGVYNIRVNAIAPGPTATDMLAYVKDKVGEYYLKNCAMNRIAAPEEIAKVVMFLASDDASYLNGEVIRVDGGAR